MADAVIADGHDCSVERSDFQQRIDRTSESTRKHFDIKLLTGFGTNAEAIHVTRFLQQSIQSNRQFDGRGIQFRRRCIRLLFQSVAKRVHSERQTGRGNHAIVLTENLRQPGRMLQQRDLLRDRATRITTERDCNRLPCLTACRIAPLRCGERSNVQSVTTGFIAFEVRFMQLHDVVTVFRSDERNHRILSSQRSIIDRGQPFAGRAHDVQHGIQHRSTGSHGFGFGRQSITFL